MRCAVDVMMEDARTELVEKKMLLIDAQEKAQAGDIEQSMVAQD